MMEEKKDGNTVVIIAAIALLLATVGIGYYFYSEKNKIIPIKEKPKENDSDFSDDKGIVEMDRKKHERVIAIYKNANTIAHRSRVRNRFDPIKGVFFDTLLKMSNAELILTNEIFKILVLLPKEPSREDVQSLYYSLEELDATFDRKVYPLIDSKLSSCLSIMSLPIETQKGKVNENKIKKEVIPKKENPATSQRKVTNQTDVIKQEQDKITPKQNQVYLAA